MDHRDHSLRWGCSLTGQLVEPRLVQRWGFCHGQQSSLLQGATSRYLFVFARYFAYFPGAVQGSGCYSAWVARSNDAPIGFTTPWAIA